MPETDPKILLAHILHARHNPDVVQALLQDLVDEKGPEEIIYNLAHAVMGVTQVLHQMCHLSDNLDRMVDTMVAGGPGALNARFTDSLDEEKLLSEEYSRHVFQELIDGTDPQDRIWSLTTMPNGQRVVTLDGSGFHRRVFAIVGASDENVTAFKDLMVRYEQELK